MANTGLNTQFCTLDDVSQFAQQVNQFIINLTEIINNGVASDHKVAVNATDNTNATYDYLHAKINQAGAGLDGRAQLAVKSVTISNLTESLYADFESIEQYNYYPLMFLAIDEGVLVWTTVDAAIDNFTVKVTSGDSQADFLHNKFNLNVSYVGGADILVGTQTVGASSTVQSERLFVDVSAISGWNATGTHVLGLVDNVSEYLAVSTVFSSVATIIRGLATSAVEASASTFTINNVVALANGNNPTGGNAATTVTITKVLKESFPSGAVVTAVRNAGSATWEEIAVERYRAIRGDFSSTVDATHIKIKAIVVLDSGVDPRTDTTSSTEEVTVTIVDGSSFTTGDKVRADWSVANNQWEARQKSRDGASGTFVCTLAAAISAGSTTTMGSGTGTVYSIGHGSTLTLVGTRTIFNPFKISLPASSGGDTVQYTCAKTYDDATDSLDEFTVTGMDPLHILASLSAYGATKSLYTDGGSVTDMKFGGKQCST